MRIIAGLGNPGKQYENTRHNVGFLTLDRLAEENGIKINKIKHKALVGEGHISGQKVLLVKPQTFMNLSGNSIREVMEYYKAEPWELLVIYDDIDLVPGALRIRKRGSAGTHNGMRSIVYDLQYDTFPRLRIGIGGERKMPLDRYVTSGFSKEELPLIRAAISKGVKAVECLLAKDIDVAMNEYNIKPQTEGDKKQDG